MPPHWRACASAEVSSRWLLLLLLSASPLGRVAQISSPVANNRQLSPDQQNSKYRSRHADLDKEGDIQHESPVPGAQRCGHHRLDLAWMSEATSSVYASPLITDLHADGRRDIIVPSFVHYLEVLEGPNGGQAIGWPAFHASSVHASPLLYDIDFDGVRDILLATYDGQILAFRDTGEKMAEGIQVSRLRVRKGWYVGLDPKDPFDHSHPDVGDGNGGLKQTSGVKSGTANSTGNIGALTGINAGEDLTDRQHTSNMGDRVKRFVRQIMEYRKKYGDAAADKLMAEARTTNAIFYDAVVASLNMTSPSPTAQQHQEGAGGGSVSPSSHGTTRRRLLQMDSPDTTTTTTNSPGDSSTHTTTGDDSGHAVSGGVTDGIATAELPGGDEAVSQEAASSFEVFEDDPLHDRYPYGFFDGAVDGDNAWGANGTTLDSGDAGDSDGGELDSFLQRLEYDEFGDLESTAALREGTAAEHEHGVDPRAADPDELRTDAYKHLYLGDYVPGGGGRGRWGREQGWGEEDFTQSTHRISSGHVYVDPHIMTTPAIADIDGDGHDELVLAVSYFYDREYYDDPDHAGDLKGIDIGKYVASGVAVFDLRTRREKWVQHLDLSTDTTDYKAYAYSSPTLVDLNGDGRLEIVVGTSMGFLYVLDCTGAPVAGWPIQMGEIQAQPLVADINNDGDLEVVVADMRGNLAAFTSKGEEVWERHVRSAVSQGAVAGDIDGDGQLEVVLGTSSGFVYALAGSTGADIPNWPYRARGRVQAAPTITQLIEGTGLQVVVPAFDGFLYVIDGLQGCADVADIGETSYAAVLSDDLDGDGSLELLVTTMNGNVYAFETGAPYHPLKTWTSQVLGPNGQVARYGYVGIFATPATRRPRDVAGERLQVHFEVVDKRVAFAPNGSLIPGGRGPYNVTIVLKGVGVKEMASGDAPVVGVADSFPGPGKYAVDIPCPKTQASAVVRLELVDSAGLSYADEFALSFHMHFHRLFKWVIALPLGIMLGVLLAGAGAPGRAQYGV